MKNRIGLLSIIPPLIVYAVVLVALYTAGGVWLAVGAIYIGACVVIAYLCYRRVVAQQTADTASFRKNFPLNPFGEIVASFHHVFHAEDAILDEVQTRVQDAISERTALPHPEEIRLKDVDPALGSPEERSFRKATGPENRRNSAISLVFNTNRKARMQSFTWWVLASGYVDRSKLSKFIAYAPVRLPFWIIPYLHHTFDLMSRVRTIHEGFYNELDIVTEARGVHETVFDTMVEVLDGHGIDISDLKAQRSQIMNIDIRGGRTQIGQIIQGAIARITPQPQRQGTARS
jgi:hypothetical protein